MLPFRGEFSLFPCSALLQEIKVLVVAHNIPTRLFSDWYVVTAMSPVAHPPDSMQSQSTAEVVAECLTLLCQVAASMQSFEVNFTELRNLPSLPPNQEPSSRSCLSGSAHKHPHLRGCQKQCQSITNPHYFIPSFLLDLCRVILRSHCVTALKPALCYQGRRRGHERRCTHRCTRAPHPGRGH